MHARTTTGTKTDERTIGGNRCLNTLHKALPHSSSHRTTNKTKLKRRSHQRLLVYQALHNQQRAFLACFFARFLFRDWVQSKLGDKLQMVNRGIENEGAFYLFTMRLIPVFPFFVINLVMGLTKMSLFTFYWVSQIGMIAGTVVYMNAGKELARIDSLSGILSLRLLLSFAILGVFPITVKKLMGWYRTKKGRPEIAPGQKETPPDLEP